MINNRQGGRRRGRGGQGGGRHLGGQPGNRQDNRQRGNAAQLLEKYKNLARDAQLAGDRVQTEYYLQYADHYFRVLGESRSRFEDQRPRRDQDMDEDEGDEDMLETADADGGDEREERDEPRDRPRERNRNRGERTRYSRDDRDGNRGGDDNRDDRDSGRGGDDSRGDSQPMLNGGDSLPLDVLPPAIGADSAAALADEEPAPARPRRRSRAARPVEGEDDVAPAA